MEENIAGWLFDLRKPIYLLHPNNKFWEATLNATGVKYRVGKLKDDVEGSIQEVEKNYPSLATSKGSVLSKIQEKLTKGYYPKDAKKVQNKQKQEKQVKNQTKSQKGNKKTIYTGQYYQKGSQAMRLQVNDKKVKITRIGADGRQKFQIRTMKSYQDAVDFCLKEQEWIVNEGYKANNHKFTYSFIDDTNQKLQSQKQDKSKSKKQDTNKNFLSVISMTDDAMSHRSRNNSQTRSDRSYVDAGSDNKYIPTKLGSPISSCIKVLLAETWSDEIDPAGWIMSQKLDGVRCFWTGTTMYSRNANRFFFPKFFTKNWPNSQLDGQLFIGRGRFSQTLSAVKKNIPIDSQWEKVKYLVFDCPGLNKPFKTRIQQMEEVIKNVDNPYIKCHAHRVCNGFTDLFEELEKVNKAEGQGLMLRDPQSKYENRRSKTLLKVKTFYDDQATVIGYKPGTGRCTGMVGALKCRNSKGTQFECGSGLTDDDRRRPPKIGSKITYKYQELNKDSGKPRFPIYLRPYDHV